MGPLRVRGLCPENDGDKEVQEMSAPHRLRQEHLPLALMSGRRLTRLVTVVVAALWLLALPAGALAQGNTTIDPSDPRLVPNPIGSSDEGTAWTCRVTGSDVQCTGMFAITWELDGPIELCSAPLYSVNGSFTRIQTRYYSLDAASGDYLEYKRLIHLDFSDSLTPDPDPSATNIVLTRLGMTWISTFDVPGDLASVVIRKQGIDTFIKRPDGGIVLLDVGQKSTFMGEDFDFRGRWDIHLGDEAVELAKICGALGL
jgi:hypothetical protein